ncbi:AAA family ATPase [Agrobacterium sp. NPDC090273]|uniref:AAA family ATPase n=1 Tax=Agrobacterium sp. NPDC090273 TaxID=3363919 RepID=UPI00383ABA3C
MEKSVSAFDLEGLAILVAMNIEEVPLEVRFAAAAILAIELPTPSEIQAIRRLTGRSPLPDRVTALLTTSTQSILLAAIGRQTIDEEHISMLSDIQSSSFHAPSLFELPGYEALKDWARQLAKDVNLCREGKLSWKKIRTGVLIHGPTGVGKTFAAKALAESLGMKFVESSVGAWQSKGHLGDMLAAMRGCFQAAQDSRGAVLFIDELDSIGSRGNFTDDAHGQYWQLVVNEFLIRLDKLQDNVLLIGATNFPLLIDPAVLRSGRIENKFAISLPDSETRAAILKWHTSGKIEFESLLEIAEHLEGWSGSDLERLVRDASAISRNQDRDLEIGDLLAKIPERGSFSPNDMFRLSVHEAGHALVALSLGYATSAVITIKPTFDPASPGRLGGVTEYEYEEKHIPTDATLCNGIAVSYAGMGAEFVVFGDRSTGSGSDVERATTIARRLVYSYGLGNTPIFAEMNPRVKDSAINWRLEDNVFEILDAQYERVLAMLEPQRDRIIALAKEVMLSLHIKIECAE